MTNDECRKHVSAMIAGEAEMNLRLLRMCALSMGSATDTPAVTTATAQMIEAAELLDAAIIHDLPRSIMETLREAARYALSALVETSTTGASPRRD